MKESIPIVDKHLLRDTFTPVVSNSFRPNTSINCNSSLKSIVHQKANEKSNPRIKDEHKESMSNLDFVKLHNAQPSYTTLEQSQANPSGEAYRK